MENTRIALAQVSCPFTEIENNLSKHEEYARKAAAAGAGFICFPECSLTGYPAHADPRIPEISMSFEADPVKTIAGLSRDIGIVILAGMIQEDDGKAFNTQFVAAGGELAGAYSKTHICESEGKCITPGNELPVWTINGITFGIQLCYDNHFPESARALTLQGAEVLFCPYGSPGPCNREGYEAKQARWLRYQTARAFDNSLFLCVVNQIHSSPGAKRVRSRPEDTHCGVDEYPGGSMVLNPWGEVIARARMEQEDLLIVDLESETLNKKIEDPLQNFMRFRRPDLYHSLLDT
jgi:predicted amidohydrolase